MPDLHARLLARIDLDDEDNHAGFRCGSIDALRTVVELHAPDAFGECSAPCFDSSENQMTTVDLDAIRARHAAFEAAWDHEFCGPDGPKYAAASAEDVPALLAEVNRLQNIFNRTAVLTISIDGDMLHPDADIPAGELQRALFDREGS